MSKKDRGHAQAAKDHENEAGRDAGLDQRNEAVSDGRGRIHSPDSSGNSEDGRGAPQGEPDAQSAGIAGQVVDVASGNMVGVGDDNAGEAGADSGKPVVDTPDYLLEAMGEDVQTPLFDTFTEYMNGTGTLIGGLLSSAGKSTAFDELFGFYRDNPTAPDQAGLIHIKRKLHIDVDQTDPLFPIVLSSLRTLVVGVLAHDAAVKKAEAEAGKPAQDRAPMHGETALTPEPQPFAPTGFSPSA